MPQWTRYGTVTATAHLAADQLAEAQAEIAQGLSMARSPSFVDLRGTLAAKLAALRDILPRRE